MSSERDDFQEVYLGDAGDTPVYSFDDRHQEPEPGLDVFAEYGRNPDAFGGSDTHDSDRVLSGEPGPGEDDEVSVPIDEHLPRNELLDDDVQHVASGSHAPTGRTDAPDGGPGDNHNEGATSSDKQEVPGRVIEVFYERPEPPSAERLALIGAMGRVQRAAEGNQIPASAKEKLREPSDAVTMATITRLAVNTMRERARAEDAESSGATDADLVTKGTADPEHLRAAMQKSGPGKFMDALGEVNVERDIMGPINESKGFAAALENADPDAFLETVRTRNPSEFWYGEKVDKRQPKGADEGAQTRYIGLLLDPEFAGRNPGDARRNMSAESRRLTNLIRLNSGIHRPSDPEDDVMAVKNYIDHLNETERDWMIWHGRGVPGESQGEITNRTISPHHADRLEHFLSFARPLMERLGNDGFEADMFTAQIVREIAEAKIEIRRQAEYRDGPDSFAAGRRVAGLSADDLANLALAARFEERAAKSEKAKDGDPAKVIRDSWDDVIRREDRLFQADLQRRHPERFRPGVPPPVSPRHFVEQLGQIGFNFRARLGGHMEGPDPEQTGLAAANAGLVADLQQFMDDRERTRHEVRVAMSPNLARTMGGDRPNGLSREQIRDWAILAAVKLNVAMQPETGGTGSEAELLMEEVTNISIRDLSLRQSAAHQANPGDLYSGKLPTMTREDIEALVQTAAMSASIKLQTAGKQAAHEFIAETARDLHLLLQGRDAHDMHGGDLARILRGSSTQDGLLRMSDPALVVARDAAKQAMEESERLGIPPDPDVARRYQMLEDHFHGIKHDHSGALEAARTSAQLLSAQRAVDALNKPERAIHITSGPGPEHPELLVALAAAFGVFEQISVSGTNQLNRQLGILAGQEISPVANRDLVAQTTGYRSAETQIVQGRAPATFDPYQLLRDPNVQNIIIQDIPPNRGVINKILELIDDEDPRALFFGQFNVEPRPTGWVDPTTLDLDMGDEESPDYDPRVTVWFRRNQAA